MNLIFYVVAMLILLFIVIIILFIVNKNRKLTKISEVIYELLPGINCKRCGRNNCVEFAEDLSSGKTSLKMCPYLTGKNYYKCRQILKRERKVRLDSIAFVKCKGGKDCKNKFEYIGDKTCKSKTMLHGGDKCCPFACLGCGDCKKACVYGAISISDKGCAVIDKNKCVGCGECVSACPKNLIQMIPTNKFVDVVCNNTSNDATSARACSVSCIHCGSCETICPSGAIKLVNGLPIIDKKKCTKCGKCVAVCPNHVISRL